MMDRLKLAGYALLIGFVLGIFLGYTTLSPGEDDFQDIYFTTLAQGEAAALRDGSAAILELYDENLSDEENFELLRERLKD